MYTYFTKNKKFYIHENASILQTKKIGAHENKLIKIYVKYLT